MNESGSAVLRRPTSFISVVASYSLHVTAQTQTLFVPIS